VKDRGEREVQTDRRGEKDERMSARAKARETHRKRQRERGGEREKAREGERDRVRERTAVHVEAPAGSRDLAHAHGHTHARTLVAGVGEFCIAWQSAAYVTVKRRPLASVSTPAVGRCCASAPVNDHPAELVKVPCP